MSKIFLKGGTIVTNDPKLGELRPGDLLIENNKITAIGPKLDVPDGTEVIDARRKLVIPGMIDTHRHTWQSLLRAAGVDWTLGQYYTGVRVQMGGQFTPDDMQLANYLGALECIDAGITTLYDWSHNNNTPDHADGAVQGLRDAGIRAIWGYGNSNDQWLPPSGQPTNLTDVKRMRESQFASNDGLVRMSFAARGPDVVGIEMTEEEFRFAWELGLDITVHVGFGPWTQAPMKRLKERGLLRPSTVFVHCCTLSDEDIKILADSGASSSIAPESELNMGMGDLPTMRLLKHGHRISISTDVVSSAPGDLFTPMRTVLTTARADVAREMLAQGGELDPIPLTSKEVFEFGTVQGAKACGYEGSLGVLAPGMLADIVLLETQATNMMPLNYSYGAIVEAAHVGNVDTVIVDGRIRKRAGKLVGVDLGALNDKVDAARDTLFEKVGISSNSHWMPKPHTKASVESEGEF